MVHIQDTGFGGPFLAREGSSDRVSEAGSMGARDKDNEALPQGRRAADRWNVTAAALIEGPWDVPEGHTSSS